jgi:hypothetical protein
MNYATESYVHQSTATEVSEERWNSASSTRRPPGWQAAPAAVAAMVLLAVGSGGCSTSPGQHSGGHGSGSAKAAGRPRDGAMSAMAGVTNGVMFGGDVPLATAESKLGRKLAIVRVYDRMGQHFSNPKLDRIMAGGTTVLASLDTFPGGASYAAIAAGRQDAAIKPWLNEAEQSAVKYHLPAIYVTFEHEANVPSHHRGLGTPAQFARAWDHVHQLATAAHLNWNDGGRLHWVFILAHFAYTNGQASRFWPGTHEVDIAGADGYNTGGCRKARAAHTHFTTGKTPPVTPAALFTSVVRFAASHGSLPVFIAEWGSVAYRNQNVRVTWIHQMQAFVQANPEIAAALYWDSQVAPCNYIINNSPTSLSALTGMAHAPDMQGRPTAT